MADMAQCDTLGFLPRDNGCSVFYRASIRGMCARLPRETKVRPARRSRMSKMDPDRKGIMESVKNQMVGSIKGTGEVLNAVVDTVSGTLVTTIKGTGAVGK